MNRETAISFLRALGVREDRIVSEDRDWVRCSCPFAHWTHKGTDEKPSFGIKISDDPNVSSIASCYSCGPRLYSGTKNYWFSHEILVLFKKLSGIRPASAFRIFALNEAISEYDRIDIEMKTYEQEKYSKIPLPLDFINNSYPTLESVQSKPTIHAATCFNYLTKFRDLKYATLKRFGVRFNALNGNMVFPLTDSSNTVYHLRERISEPNVKRMWTVDSKTSGRTDIFFSRILGTGASFGLGLFDYGIREAVMVEGEIDNMRLWEYGQRNVVATATTSYTISQAYAILPYVDVLYMAYDADKAGYGAALRMKRIIQSFSVRVRVVIFQLLGVKDPDDLMHKDDWLFLKKNSLPLDQFLADYEWLVKQ